MNQMTCYDDGLITNHITVRKAAEYSGYYRQYLRRILREGGIDDFRVGSIWLINASSLEAYVNLGNCTEDKRRGPRFGEQLTPCLRHLGEWHEATDS